MHAIEWLLEDDNPAVQYRTATELLDDTADKKRAIRWALGLLPESWQAAEGLWYAYYLTALAECGLTCRDVEIDGDRAMRLLREGAFDYGCADFMQLRAMVMLGFLQNPAFRGHVQSLEVEQLPDGGFLCLHRRDKMKHTPKSCYKANNHALLLASECHKRGIRLSITEPLLQYYWSHSIFYRQSDPSQLILPAKPGWRTIDTFFPLEPMRVGLQNMVEALSALGYGADARLADARAMLEAKKDVGGRYALDGTLSKPYLKKERAGSPSKWVTFYALLAEKHRTQGHGKTPENQ